MLGLDRRTGAVLVVALIVASSAAVAETLQIADAIKLRRAAYALQGHYFSELKPMATGKQPFDAAAAQRALARVETLSQIVPEFFPAGSDQGETKARPEIWSEAADFKTKQQKSLADVGKLSAAAQAGDAEAFKASYLDAVGSCKDCHESYRRR